MLWTIFVILLVMWALGLVTSYTLGGFVHILLVIALVMLVVNLVQGRRIEQAFRLCDEARNLMRINPITLVGIALIVSRDCGLCVQGHHLHEPREDYRYRPHPSHRRHPEDHPALPSLGRVGACRRDCLGGGRSQEGVVQLGVSRWCPQSAVDEVH